MEDKKRISVKYKTPNPLFEKWLSEWHKQAKEHDSKMQFTFNAALKSLRKYPLPFESGKECIILKGFGNKLCDMLDKKLKDYKKNHKHDDDDDVVVPTISPKKQTPKKVKPKPKSPGAKDNRPYKPAEGTGPYALLIALLKKSQEPNNSGSFTKAEIIDQAKHLCNTSFTKPEPGSFYTAWTSMSTLISKGFVVKKGSPAKFKLSENGDRLAIELFQEMENSIPKTDDNIIAQNITTSIRNICTSTEITTNLVSKIDNILRSDTVTNNNISENSAESSNSGGSSQVSSNTETTIFQPGHFDIILLVDNHETAGAKDPSDDEILSELDKHQIKYEVRHLKVGDFTWICREKDTKEELILPYIAERKRMDDLGHSIKDGRFHEQKFRLKQCGIQNLIYIVESYGNNTRTCLPLSSLLQGATNTLIQDQFQVKFTENQRHSMQYLSGVTMMLAHVYQQKTLVTCTKENLANTNVMDDLIPLMVFKDFNKGASKTKKFKVKEVFLRQILQLHGVSVDKALAIANKYPTPKILKMEYDMLDACQGEKLLANITFGPLKKSIGPVISKSIYQLYTLTMLN